MQRKETLWVIADEGLHRPLEGDFKRFIVELRVHSVTWKMSLAFALYSSRPLPDASTADDLDQDSDYWADQ